MMPSKLRKLSYFAGMKTLSELYTAFLFGNGISTDTRKIIPGGLFFALKGSNFDGNDFAEAALTQGASLAVVDRPALEHLPGMWLVNDVLNTLQELAQLHRNTLKTTLICIGGSNGKTTTKELTYACLSAAAPTLATPGNLNNHIGLPLTLLMLKPEHRWGIIEIGANHAGETASLAWLASPQAALITNNGKDHLEGFGSVEGVRAANAELYEHLRLFGGQALVPDFQPDLMEDSQDLNRIVYGWEKSSTWQGVPIKSGHLAGLHMSDWEAPVVSQLAGHFNSENMMHAVALARWCGVSEEHIRQGLSEYRPQLMRSQYIEGGGLNILLDAYNANPSSMEAALRSFVAEAHRPFGFILGDMLEMGKAAEEEHRSILALAKAFNPDFMWCIGSEFEKQKEFGPDCALYFKDTETAKAHALANPALKGEVLIKGSRGYKLEGLLGVFSR
jgi:UDP-N-acetylmuramoyl-tripeptide--D-alanyl-D-alanine ligase